MISAPEAWANLLEDDERIIWQGQPLRKKRLPMRDLAYAGSALLSVPLAYLVWRQFESPDLLITLIICAVIISGIWSVLAPPVLRIYRQRYSFYTLTDRRAFIAHRLPLASRSLDQWRIGPKMQIELVKYRDGAGSVLFASQPYPWYFRREGEERVGFQNIADAERVFSLMVTLQEEIG